MTEDFIDFATLRGMKDMFRDYDLELEFERQMYCLMELKYPFAVVVFKDDPVMVGWNWLLVFEAVNDNALGTV